MRRESSPEPVKPAAKAELAKLVTAAQAGDITVLPRIRQILDKHPEVWRHAADLSALVEHTWLRVLSAEHPLAKELFARKIAEMKAELAGPHPTPLETLLVEQVIACWMEVTHLETLTAQGGTGTIAQARFHLHRLESAQRRYHRAITTLTDLRQRMPAGLAPGGSIKLYAAERAHAPKRAAQG